jgi:hypothetical protein
MARRIPWEQLSREYRERLARKGITPQKHAAGESIKAARGHAHTPERPITKSSEPKFKDYVTDRSDLIRKVARKKRELFAGSEKWQGKRATKNITESTVSNRELRKFLSMGEDYISDPDFDWKDEENSWLWYH